MSKIVKRIIYLFLTIFCQLIFFFSVAGTVLATEPIGEWKPTSPLPYAVASHISYLTHGKVSVVAGASFVATSSYSYSNINPDNTLSDWSETTLPYPQSIFWHSSAFYNNYIYGFGGATFPPTNSVNSTYKGTLIAGVVNSWTPQTLLPENLSLGGSAALGNWVYFAGGYTAINSAIIKYSNKVYKVDIDPATGNLGVWSETTSLPLPLNGFGMIEAGNKLIVIGGANNNGNFQDKVWEAEVMCNGNLGPWIENISAKLPQPLYRFGIAKIGKLVVIAGGYNGTTVSDVYYSQIQPNGSLGPWTKSSNSLPKPICCGSLTASDSHLYYTGGHNTITGEYFSDVYFAKVNTNSESILEVPDIKQYSLPWGTLTYDFANSWSPSNPTIS